MEFFKRIPPTHHTLESIDCHPIPVPGEPPAKSILVNVVGTVTYGTSSANTTTTIGPNHNNNNSPQGEKGKAFTQTFILTQDLAPSVNTQTKQYFIAHDTFRLTT